MSDDHVKLNGKVVDSLKDNFTVLLENGQTVNTKISGKLRKNKIQILLGDFVEVSFSPYDLTHGLITFRNEKKSRENKTDFTK
jgi:translation initiation factor IF-1